MQIPRKYIENYSNTLNVVSEQARRKLADALSQIDYTQDVATIRNAVIAVMQPACGASTQVAAQLAADFYDGLRVRFGVVDDFEAEPQSLRIPDATDGAVRAFAQDLVEEKPLGDFIGKCVDRIDYETRRAANECVAYNAKKDPKKPKWARVPAGAETCMWCIMLASRGFAYLSEEAASHTHANCVVADTEVVGIGLLAGMRREYKGTLVNIRTSGGRNLTVTPNHPILTTRGWVVAGEIKEFDNLICANFSHGDGGSVPDVNDIPPTVKEIFESCRFMDSALFDSVPVAAKNFDSEIIRDSDIEIVNPFGFLKRAIETTINEPIKHCGFAVAQGDSSISCPLLDSFRACNLFGFGNDSTSDSIVSSGGLGGSFFGGHSRSADNPGFGLVADIGTSIGKPSDNSGTADIKTISDGINALTVIERFENAIGHWDSLTACLDAIAFEYTKNGCFIASDFLDNLFSGSARLIEIDDVESVSFSERSCHVYNLSTKGGWYVSSGIITHNCDCRIVPSWDKDNPAVQGYDPDLYYDMWKHPEKYENAQEQKQPVFEFTPASSVKEAAQYAKDNFNCEADFSGLDVRAANALNESIAAHIDMFPELKDNFGFIGSSQKCNTLRKAAWEDFYYNQSYERLTSKGLTDSDVRAHAKRAAARAVGRAHGEWAWSYSPRPEMVDFQYRGICMNKLMWNQKEYDKQEIAVRRNVDDGFHPKGCDTVESLFDHEIGHQLDSLLSVSKSQRFRAYYDPLSKDSIKDGLSEYATWNEKEFIAEAWCEYRNNPNPREHARFVGDLIMDMYKGGDRQ